MVTAWGDGYEDLAQQSQSYREIDRRCAIFSGGTLASSEQSPERLLLRHPRMEEAIHMSGTLVIKLRVASSKVLPICRCGWVTLPFDPKNVGSAGQMGVVSRAWADPQNHASLTKGGNYDSKAPCKPLKSGEFVELRFDLQPGDRIIPCWQAFGLDGVFKRPRFHFVAKGRYRIAVGFGQKPIELPCRRWCYGVEERGRVKHKFVPVWMR